MSGDTHVSAARELWLRFETIHAVTYFGQETQTAAADLGVSGFWSGYFGLRAAPMGAVGSGAVDATFCNFAPDFVRRWVPDEWTVAPPDAFVAVRAVAAASTLRRVAPGIVDAVSANDALARVVARCVAAGRPLFAANREITLPQDPVAALWQLCTTLREHRGDGHVAALAANGLDGLEAHVLISLERGSDPADLQRTRGWKSDDWAAAGVRLQRRGLIDAAGVLRDAGRLLRSTVETTTDELAAAPWAGDDDAVAVVLAALTPVARAVATSGVIRFPNPIGLPALR